MGLSVFEQEFGKARIKRGGASRIKHDAVTREQLTDIVNAVQGVVDVMRDPNTGIRYSVSLGDDAGLNASNSESKAIRITWKPIFDKSLRVSTACTVMTGLVFHEVGHTLDTFPNLDAFRAVYGDNRNWGGWGKRPFDALAYTLLNIADDARLERRQGNRYPVARDVFPTMLHWVALRTGMVGKHVAWDQRTGMKEAMAERVNFVIFATRYPWVAIWSADAVTRSERAWWQDWGRRYVAVEDDVSLMLALIAEGLARLREPQRDEPQPDEPGTEPGGEPNEDEPPTSEGKGNPAADFDEEDDESEDDEEDGEGDDDDVRDPWDEDTDEDDDEEGGDEPTDEPPTPERDPWGKGQGLDLDDEDEDEPEEPQGEPEGPGGSEDGDEPNDEPDGPEGEQGQPGDEPPPPPDDQPQDFDSRTILDVDALNRGNMDDWADRKVGRNLQQVLYEERTIERTKTGIWGTARIKPMTIAEVMRERHIV